MVIHQLLDVLPNPAGLICNSTSNKLQVVAKTLTTRMQLVETNWYYKSNLQDWVEHQAAGGSPSVFLWWWVYIWVMGIEFPLVDIVPNVVPHAAPIISADDATTNDETIEAW